VIEGQRAGNIHIASYGSASFARARLTGVKTDAFANDINADGSTGYYSMFFVKASSPYKNIDQLKGKNLGLVDPNSTSGQQRAALRTRQDGHLRCRRLFGQGGLHRQPRNAMLALSQGTVDVAANQWTSDDDSTLAQMLHKGMLKNADGTPMKKDDFRIIHKSAQIINGPLCLQFGPAGRPEGRDCQGLHRSADQGQGRVRSPLRRPEEGASIPPRPRTGMAPSS